jgi:hypothetical protein
MNSHPSSIILYLLSFSHLLSLLGQIIEPVSQYKHVSSSVSHPSYVTLCSIILMRPGGRVHLEDGIDYLRSRCIVFSLRASKRRRDWTSGGYLAVSAVGSSAAGHLSCSIVPACHLPAARRNGMDRPYFHVGTMHLSGHRYAVEICAEELCGDAAPKSRLFAAFQCGSRCPSGTITVPRSTPFRFLIGICNFIVPLRVGPIELDVALKVYKVRF